MANSITIPYTTDSSIYGSTLSNTYQWYVRYYQYPTVTDTMNSSAYVQINSFVPNGEVVKTTITIYSKNNITRQSTNGYTPDTFTFQSQPTIKLNNITLNESILLYNASLTKDVAGNSTGTQTTGSIVHTTSLTIDIPRKWFISNNSQWTFTISDILTIVNTGTTITNSKTFTAFNVAPLFMMSVAYKGTLRKVNDIIVRKNGNLYHADALVMKVGGKLVQ